MTLKEWPFLCEACSWTGKVLAWDTALDAVQCPSCGSPATLNLGPRQQAPSVIGDDIPGGVDIRHAVCNPDGSPRRFYSKTDIKRALNEAGYNWDGDTPGPYKVQWSGRRREVERPAPLTQRHRE